MNIFTKVRAILNKLDKRENIQNTKVYIIDGKTIRITKKEYTKEILTQTHLIGDKRQGVKEYNRYTIKVDEAKYSEEEIETLPKGASEILRVFIEYCDYYIKNRNRRRVKITKQPIWVRRTSTNKLSIQVRIYKGESKS